MKNSNRATQKAKKAPGLTIRKRLKIRLRKLIKPLPPAQDATQK